MKNSTRKWIRAGAETFITGLTAGASAPIGASLIDSKDWGISLHSAELFGWSALISGGLRFWHWWGTHPLPPEDDSNPPFPGSQPVISLNPLAKVVSVPAINQPPPAAPPPETKIS